MRTALAHTEVARASGTGGRAGFVGNAVRVRLDGNFGAVDEHVSDALHVLRFFLWGRGRKRVAHLEYRPTNADHAAVTEDVADADAAVHYAVGVAVFVAHEDSSADNVVRLAERESIAAGGAIERRGVLRRRITRVV